MLPGDSFPGQLLCGAADDPEAGWVLASGEAVSEGRAEQDPGHTLPKELVLCREAAPRPGWVLLWFFHKKRPARPSDGQDELTGHVLGGIWWQGESLAVRPKCLGSNLSPNHLSVCCGCLPGLPGPQSSHL